MNRAVRITEDCPTAFLLLVDQSGSMAETTLWNGARVSKAEVVSEAINALLGELAARTRRDDRYRHYYDLAVAGYCGSEVGSLLPTLGDSPFLSPEQLISNTVEVRTLQRERLLPDGRTVVTQTRQPVWVKPRSEWNTPMVGALDFACEAMKRWCAAHAGLPCHPPTVIHISDGEATDGTPAEAAAAAARLRRLGTSEGPLLFLNIHLSSSPDARPVLFPARADELPEDRYARLLFDLSSPVPESFYPEIEALTGRPAPADGVRGTAYNAEMIDLVRMMNIGTDTTGLLL